MECACLTSQPSNHRQLPRHNPSKSYAVRPLSEKQRQELATTEQASLQGQLAELKHELNLAKSSYEHYLDFILDYYRVFYRHYRMCQRTASADAHRTLPSREITYTKDEFFTALDTFLSDWAAQEGAIRLLLPAKALELHSEAIGCFNNFKTAVDQFQGTDETRNAKEDTFATIESVKSRLKTALREFLRTENLLK